MSVRRLSSVVCLRRLSGCRTLAGGTADSCAGRLMQTPHRSFRPYAAILGAALSMCSGTAPAAADEVAYLMYAPGNKGKTELRRWMDEQYGKTPSLKKRVEALVEEISIEQDLIALREERGLHGVVGLLQSGQSIAHFF